MISRKLIAASYEPIVLSILEGAATYGYDLIKRVDRLSDGSIRWTPGTLYPLLHDMEASGLVKASWQTADSGRERKYYAITAKGRRTLARTKSEWLKVNAVLARLWNAEDVGGTGTDLSPIPA